MSASPWRSGFLEEDGIIEFFLKKAFLVNKMEQVAILLFEDRAQLDFSYDAGSVVSKISTKINAKTKSWSMGWLGDELDAVLTSDGPPTLIHDETLECAQVELGISLKYSEFQNILGEILGELRGSEAVWVTPGSLLSSLRRRASIFFKTFS